MGHSSRLGLPPGEAGAGATAPSDSSAYFQQARTGGEEEGGGGEGGALPCPRLRPRQPQMQLLQPNAGMAYVDARAADVEAVQVSSMMRGAMQVRSMMRGESKFLHVYIQFLRVA